jgi:hypothetical protein
MAYTPYLRYGTTMRALADALAPVFPNPRGTKYHTVIDDRAEYVETTRKHGTTDVSWQVQNLLKPSRDLLWDFWDTTLSKGLYDVTLIDNRARMLFDVSWGAWQERWSKQRGGNHNITLDLQSPVPWTLPCLGAWPCITFNPYNHNLSGEILSMTDGEMKTHAQDSNVLSETGYGLKTTGIIDSGAQLGASLATQWTPGNGNCSISFFCQAMITGYLTEKPGGGWYNYNPLDFIRLTASNGSYFSLGGGFAGCNYITPTISDGTNIIQIRKADNNRVPMYDNSWFDLCFAYDAVNQEYRFYYKMADLSNFVDYFSGLTSYEGSDHGMAYTQVVTSGNTFIPNVSQWTELKLSNEAVADILDNKSIYLQNIFVFDGFMSPADFNTMRRLCFMWNNKTTGSWPA